MFVRLQEGRYACLQDEEPLFRFYVTLRKRGTIRKGRPFAFKIPTMEFQVLDIRIFDVLPPPRYGAKLDRLQGEQWPHRYLDAKKTSDNQRKEEAPSSTGCWRDGKCVVAVLGRGNKGDACVFVRGFRPHFVIDVLSDLGSVRKTKHQCFEEYGEETMRTRHDTAAFIAELHCEKGSVLTVAWEEVLDLHGASVTEDGNERLPRTVIRVEVASRRAYNLIRYAEDPVGVTWVRCSGGGDDVVNAVNTALSGLLTKPVVQLTRRQHASCAVGRMKVTVDTRVWGASGFVYRPALTELHDVRPTLECKFCVLSKITPSQWLQVDDVRRVFPGLQRSLCDHEFEGDLHHTKEWFRPVARDDVAPFVMCGMDIECLSEPGEFPTAKVVGDEICSVALSLWTQGESDMRRVGIVSRPCDEIEGVEVVCVASEKDLLLKMRDVVAAAGVDVVVTWNGLQFDWPYIMDRADMNNVKEDMRYLSKVCYERCRIVRDKPLASAGKGDQRLHWYAMSGRMNFDQYLWYKDNYKRAYNDLGSVCQEHIGDTKDDFPYSEIGPCYRGSPSQCARLVKYNVKDTAVLCPLMNVLCAWIDQIEQSRVSKVVVERLTTHGQGIKVVTQTAAKGASMGPIRFIFNEHYQTGTRSLSRIRTEDDAFEQDESYEGATVVEPIVGVHKMVIVNDFSSLYPSAMIANNVCISTIVKAPCSGGDRRRGLDRVGEHVFSSVCKGVLPSILEDTIARRSATKKTKAKLEELRDAKKTAAEDDPAFEAYGGKSELLKMIVVLDRRQLALKISANSVYGYLGSQTSYGDVAVAATVTGLGRSMLQTAVSGAKEVCATMKKRDGSDVGEFTLVYGDTDSIMYSLSEVVTPREGADVGLAVGAHVTSKFKKPNKLEFEKCFAPMLLFNKKRYAGLMYEESGADDMHFRGAKYSGTANQKRDICQFVHRAYNAMIEPVLYRLDTEECLRKFHACIQDLLEGRVPYEDVVITRSIKSSYKVTSCRSWREATSEEQKKKVVNAKFSAEVECKTETGLVSLCKELLFGGVARRGKLSFERAEFLSFGIVELRTNSVLRLPEDGKVEVEKGERGYRVASSDPKTSRVFVPSEDANLAQTKVCSKQEQRIKGSSTKSGRMGLIFVEPSSKDVKGNDMAEDADFVIANKLKPDAKFYIEKQAATPCGSILKLFMSEKEVAALMEKMAKEAERRRRKVVQLDAMLSVPVRSVGGGGGSGGARPALSCSSGTKRALSESKDEKGGDGRGDLPSSSSSGPRKSVGLDRWFGGRASSSSTVGNR